MRNLYLDPITYDLAVQNYNLRFTQTLTEYVSQKIENVLSTFQGEWFLNRDLGIPYYDRVLIKTADANDINNLLLTAITSIPEIEEVIKFDVEYDTAARRYRVDFEVLAVGEIITGAVTGAPTTPVSEAFIISNIEVSNGKNYDVITSGPSTDLEVYMDRTGSPYKPTSIPSILDGTQMVRTAAADDTIDTPETFLTLNVNKDAQFYLAFDNRTSPKPDWLTAGWTNTGIAMPMGDTRVDFKIWSKQFNEGGVALGPPAPLSFSTIGSMYVIFAKEAEA